MSSNICEHCGGITGHLAQRVAKGLTQSGTPAFACPGHLEPSPRDTQFKGFAEALFEDLPWNEINIDMERPGWQERWELCIARRAYDLVQHALSNEKLHWYPLEEISVSDIPDLIEWPKEQE